MDHYMADQPIVDMINIMSHTCRSISLRPVSSCCGCCCCCARWSN